MKRTFEQYMADVRCDMLRRCGMEPDDLPDYDYATAFEDGVAPETTALRAIRAAGGY